MYERLDVCPICDNEDFNNILICEDHSVTKESFAIVQCKKCQLKFTNPRPDEENINKYYNSEAYVSHSNTNKGLINTIYQQVRKYTLRQKLKLVNTYSKKGKLLDIGCGTGNFIEICQANGWEVAGVEPSQVARTQAEKLIHKKIEFDFLHPEAFKSDSFQVITLWHVLEHVHKLTEVVNKLKKILAQDGVLIIAVPNCDSHDAQYYKEHWAAYDVPRHLYHFTESTIRALLKKHKLKLDKVLPMKFDSFYVSLLSTKYKKGKVDYIEALKEGYLSNQWASAHENKYSSVIYIIRK